jgi:hypothetical protein
VEKLTNAFSFLEKRLLKAAIPDDAIAGERLKAETSTPVFMSGTSP